MVKKITVLIWDYEEQEYVPVHLSAVTMDVDDIVVGGPFKIDVDGETVYTQEVTR